MIIFLFSRPSRQLQTNIVIVNDYLVSATITTTLMWQHTMFVWSCLDGLENKNIIIFIPSPNEVAKGYSNATVRPAHPCEHSRINILQWILTKLGTYLVLKRISPKD
jgi:hypothetical protein